jgi:Ca2+-binding EF-hand superfamily protein
MRKFMAGILFVAMPVFAADQGVPDNKARDARFNQVFHGLDTNGSGSLSRQEVASKAPALAENFDNIDANRDGELTKKEIRGAIAIAEKRRQAFMSNLDAADKDKNGKLSRDEARALPNMSANFDAIDSNHDGELVMKEIADFVRASASHAPTASAR